MSSVSRVQLLLAVALGAGATQTFIVANGQDIALTIAGATLTAGIIDFYCLWRPLSADGLVVAA
jgi:hypothetical protein